MSPTMDVLPALNRILSTLPPPARHFLLHPHQVAHLTLALSTPAKTHTHSIATQTTTRPFPDSISQTLYHTLPSSNLGFQIILRSTVHATFRTFRDDTRGIFLRVANFGDKLHIACTERVSGAVRRSYQAFLTQQFTDPTFVFHVVEIGTCPICGRREVCDCSCEVSGYDGVFEGIGRAVWHELPDRVIDVITRSHVIETCDIHLAEGLQQRALGECMESTPVHLTRLILPKGRRIEPAGGTTIEQVQEDMRTRYEEETRRKIEERKMRNRRAAVQSNVKKKKMIEKMKNELEELRKRKAGLIAKEEWLRKENASLRYSLLERDEGRDLLEDALVFE